MLHQPSGGFQVCHKEIYSTLLGALEDINCIHGYDQGQASDIRIHAEEINRLSKRLNEIYAKHTGQSTDVIGIFP
jgi:hypothetical protein